MKILVALDGSTSSMHTLETALGLLSGLSDKPIVELVYVRVSLAGKGSFESLAIALEAFEKQSQEQADVMLRPYIDRLIGSGFDYSTNVLAGEPALSICMFAKHHQCELIVMGTRGQGAFPGWLLGSVASKVLTQSTVPVLLIPAPRAANEAAYEGFAFPN